MRRRRAAQIAGCARAAAGARGQISRFTVGGKGAPATQLLLRYPMIVCGLF